MSEFKPGDRVRGYNYKDRREAAREGVFVGPHGGPFDSTISDIRLDTGVVTQVWTETLEAVAPLAEWEKELLKTPVPEPEVPAAGAKVRVTFEGVVREDILRRGFSIETENGRTVYVGKATHSVEVLEGPKPELFKVGTVALDEKDLWALPVQRTFDGQWYRHGGILARGLTDEKVWDRDYNILYEPSDHDS